MLDDQLKSQLQQLLQLMEGDVVLNASIGSDDKSKELKQLLEEVAEMSPPHFNTRINTETYT
ncbi:Alkyl hydroperoxide reductase protein F [Staphylococcus gallinarum]|uniref:Alkyl hydroperoxide reductase protein F n=1 Tax=Staphylococcus gallinarum TaxID=1293 RepID=A0A380FAV1_STAGA|nr:Alkyl hydroperoxide reductase protein F [Staphylococcus gallinarum]